VSRLELTLACLDSDRVQPLVTRRVQPAGIDLNILPYSADKAVWPMIRHQEFDASEMTLAVYVNRRVAGQARYIAIPVFLARTFPHGGIFVNRSAGIREPKDLEGKRVASGQFLMSIAVWARGIFRHEYGIDLEAVDWCAARAEVEVELPPELRVTLLPPGRTLPERLEQGEIDALIAPRVPPQFRDGHPRVARLFPDPREVELAYFRKTGIFPILHTVVIKESVYERHPWVASSLFRAFAEAKQICYRDLSETMEGLRYTIPWLDSWMAEVQEVMGEDFWPYGLEANRRVLETYVRYLHEQHLLERVVPVEELFAPNALD
jgi:4,5-dihydroxyphthalate decarboxylase